MLEDRLDHGAVLACQLLGAFGRLRIVDRLDLHVQGSLVADGTGPNAGPAHAPDHERESAVRQLTGVLDLRDRSDLGVAAVDARHEHEPAAGLLGRRAGALGLVGLERDRHDHLREDDALREREHRKEVGARVELTGAQRSRVQLRGVASRFEVGHLLPSRWSGNLSNTTPTAPPAVRFPTLAVGLTAGPALACSP